MSALSPEQAQIYCYNILSCDIIARYKLLCIHRSNDILSTFLAWSCACSLTVRRFHYVLLASSDWHFVNTYMKATPEVIMLLVLHPEKVSLLVGATCSCSS